MNIYNYKNILGNINNKRGSTNEDEVIKTLLIKIDEKNIEELLKDKEKLMKLQKKTLKGLSHKIEPLTHNNTLWKTFNKNSSIESINNQYNQSNYKSNKSKESVNFNSSSKIFKNNNSLSIDTNSNYVKDNYNRNFSLPKKYHSRTLNKKLQNIFHIINAEERIAEKNSYILNTFNNSKKYYKILRLEKYNLKSNSINKEQFRKKKKCIKKYR